MKIHELIKILEKLPLNSKVLINADLGWYDLEDKDVEYRKVYNIWHSGYNSNRTPYVDYSSKPRDFTYVHENNSTYYEKIPDYVCKTVGEEFVILLG